MTDRKFIRQGLAVHGNIQTLPAVWRKPEISRVPTPNTVTTITLYDGRDPLPAPPPDDEVPKPYPGSDGDKDEPCE